MSALAAEPSLAGYTLGMSTQDVQATGQAKDCVASEGGGISCSGGQLQLGGESLWLSFDIIDGRVWRILATGKVDAAGKIREDFVRRYGVAEVIPITSKVLNQGGMTGAYRWTGDSSYLTVSTMDSMLVVMLAPRK